MNIPTESKLLESLHCEACDHIKFSSYAQFQFHHLHHIRQPLVRLVRLSPTLSWKLQWKSYKVNSGVARKSNKLNHVPPLKITLINQQGRKEFCIKKEDLSSCGSSSNTNCLSSGSDSNPGESLVNTHKLLVKGPREVEGKNLLERLGAGFSVSRKPAKPMAPTATKPKEEADGVSSAETKKDNILERLSGIGGITISKSSNGNSESKSGGVSISTKQKLLDLTQLKNLKEQILENDKKVFDKNKILEKLSGSGISIASKTTSQKDGCKTKGESEAESPKPDPQERLANKLNKSEDSNDSSDSKMSTDSRTSHVNASDEVGKNANENSLVVEQKKFIRVKQSSFSKKNMKPERQSSQEELPDEKEKTDAVGEETGINILERLTENLNNSVGAEKSAEVINNPVESEPEVAENEDPLAVDTGNLNPPIDASDSFSEEVGSAASFNVAVEDHLEDQEQGQGLLMTPPRSSSQDRSSPNFSTMSQNQPEYGESDNVSDGGQEVTEETFSGLSQEDQNCDQGEQQTAFWSDIQNSSDNVDQPQEDPLLTPENSVPNGDSNFLHNFTSEYQSGAGNMASENSEFMSLDRLAQSQHQQRSYGAESSSPMEQLNQQVQRIPNPSPQINVISQHHLQGPPPPPQLHTGVPLSPQHISPQQANSYDSLSQMQPPLPPPPLYQGYMYNQSYPPPPQIPRPPQPQMPMLQQRPHISARSFQPMHVPTQRPRLRSGIKRNLMRPPEMITPPKQARMTSPLQVGHQVTNPATKLPSGITVTPPKKTLEANKVANVLASRGITVTPSGSRQATPQSARSQQSQRSQNSLNASIIKLGGSVSITSPAQNRSGGFAVPTAGPRRSAPIVNHNAERPERCMTVDLTQDDEVPQSRNRIPPPLRHSCQQCGKYFASLPALAAHEVHHRNMPFKCSVCSAEFTAMNHLVSHRQTHLKKTMSPDLAIPIVDLNHPGARDQLRKCGISNFIPLAQLQSTNNGYFGVPIIQLDTAREKAVSNLSHLGAGNIFVLGKMKSLTSQQNH